MAPRAKKPNRGGMAFGRNLAILGLIPFVLGAYATVMGAMTLRWPRAEAIIIGCEQVWPENDSRNIGSPEHSKGWSTAHLTYAYHAGGEERTGSGVEAYALGLVNAAHEDELCLTYQPHQQVKIAYDPGNVDVAYLEPGPSNPALMLLGIGAFMMLCGWLVHTLARRGIGRMNAEGATEHIKRHRDSADRSPLP
jgi:uncharacterized protein DUF3592